MDGLERKRGRTLKRRLHHAEQWQMCPKTWDATVTEARRRLGFEPSERPSWLTGPRATVLFRAGVAVLTQDAFLGRAASNHWGGLIEYWCACVVAPWPDYNGQRAAREALRLPGRFGDGTTFRIGSCRLRWHAGEASAREVEVIPSLGMALAVEFRDGKVGHRSLGWEDLKEDDQRAWRHSEVWRQLERDQGPNPWRDAQLSHRTKVDPGAVDGQTEQLRRRYMKLVEAHGPQEAIDTVLSEEAAKYTAEVAAILHNPDALQKLKKRVFTRVRNTLVRAARRDRRPVPPPPSREWWPPRTRPE